MKPEDQIKALAELDGFESANVPNFEERFVWWNLKSKEWECPKEYLTSLDAIMPVVEKHIWKEGISGFAKSLFVTLDNMSYKNLHPDILVGCVISATAEQLCETLLRATNQWKG